MPVPTELLVFARKLRKDQTDAENLMWQILRGRRFCGFKFRRQFPFMGYVLDFYCHDVRLAVELDGGGHGGDEQQNHDQVRTSILESFGIRVIRFWNHEVLNSLDDVLSELHAHLFATPVQMPPHPPLRGTFSLGEKE